MTEAQLIQLPQQFGDVTAIRYGDANGDFDEGAPARIAQFVLGHDVDTRVTILNERLMGVVVPVDMFWDPGHGVADIVVTDTKSGVRLALGLGQWLARYPNGALRPLTHNQMIAQHFPRPEPRTFEEELTTLINKHGLEGGSDTPDFILAMYLSGCLKTYNNTILRRDRWNRNGV